jgi:hypothetical protein
MSDFNIGLIGTFLITLLILSVIFLFCRELVCWYWKVNHIVALLTEIRDLLAKNSTHMASPTVAQLASFQTEQPTTASIVEADGVCPNCKAAISLASETCPKCQASFVFGSAWKVTPR